ncbi:uncharacterized protein LOC134772326 [Penaeus indicus]|uniref:uncharacterized protein LOC134772326 n=1 Tax=Penaeus indicus TaxID=29960 RepID=UPI00300CEA54
MKKGKCSWRTHGGDLNGHVSKRSDGYQRVHGGKGYVQRNTEGERILECAESLNMAVVNTFYQKRDEHLITYKSGQHATQIDYVMIRRADLKSVRNCKIIPGEAVVAQHRLLYFQEKVREKQVPKTETVQEDWQSTKSALLETAEEVCGTTKGRRYQGRETWWWSTEVQEAIRRKKVASKAWQSDRDENLRETYKEAKRKAKRAVAKAKEEAWREWYEKMETNEGERIIYKVAKQRVQSRQDVGEDYPTVKAPFPNINEKEVEETMKKIKSGRATGCSGLPVDLLKHLGKEGIQMVTSLLQKV